MIWAAAFLLLLSTGFDSPEKALTIPGKSAAISAENKNNGVAQTIPGKDKVEAVSNEKTPEIQNGASTANDYAATADRVKKSMSSLGVVAPQKKNAKELSDNSKETTITGHKILPKTPEAPPESATPVLVETSKSEDIYTRIQGLEGLAQSNAMENIDAFVDAVADPIPEIRQAAASILSRMDPALVSEKILKALCSGDTEAMERMDDVLGLMKDSLEPGMLHVLQSDDAPSLQKQAAAYTLGRINSTVAIPTLTARVNQPDADLAITCANALMALNDPMLIPTLLNLTQHPIQQIRWAAVQCVADLGGPESLEALGRVAITPPEGDAELGRRAVVLLGNTRSNAATPVLIEVMRRNLSLRRAAVEALHKITGQDLGDRPSEWQAWYETSLQQPSPDQMQDSEDSPYAVEFMP